MVFIILGKNNFLIFSIRVLEVELLAFLAAGTRGKSFFLRHILINIRAKSNRRSSRKSANSCRDLVFPGWDLVEISSCCETREILVPPSCSASLGVGIIQNDALHRPRNRRTIPLHSGSRWIIQNDVQLGPHRINHDFTFPAGEAGLQSLGIDSLGETLPWSDGKWLVGPEDEEKNSYLVDLWKSKLGLSGGFARKPFAQRVENAFRLFRQLQAGRLVGDGIEPEGLEQSVGNVGSQHNLRTGDRSRVSDGGLNGRLRQVYKGHRYNFAFTGKWKSPDPEIPCDAMRKAFDGNSCFYGVEHLDIGMPSDHTPARQESAP